MLPRLHMCTTHMHTDTPVPHSPLLSPTGLSGSWAGLLRQLPSLSIEDSRSQPLCRELAFCVPIILGRGHRRRRTSLFLSEILRRNAQWLVFPQPGDRMCICHKGSLTSGLSKAFNLLRFSGPSLEAAPNTVLLRMTGNTVGGRGAWLASHPPPSVSPLGGQVGGASEKNPRAISALLGSHPQPAGNLVTGE